MVGLGLGVAWLAAVLVLVNVTHKPAAWALLGVSFLLMYPFRRR